MSKRSTGSDDDMGTNFMRRVKLKAGHAWTAVDFVDLSNRDVIDKILPRLTKVGDLRRIDRELYDCASHHVRKWQNASSFRDKRPPQPFFRETR